MFYKCLISFYCELEAALCFTLMKIIKSLYILNRSDSYKTHLTLTEYIISEIGTFFNFRFFV